MSDLHLGWYRAGAGRSHVRFLFTTHAAAGANVAPNSAFEAADIRIYRANAGAAHSATQRSSANGITMTSPFDSLTGVHEVVIDLTDNTDAGFYATGYQYTVMLSPDETVDSQTISGIVLAVFEIGDMGIAPVNVTYVIGVDAASQITEECSTALTTYYLDKLLANNFDPASPGAGSSGSILRRLTENDAGDLRFTTEALEQAPTGGGGATAADIADAVLDEAMAGHTTAGSLGKYIADILEDTGTTLDGKIDTIDDLIDTEIAGITTLLDTEIADIKAKTDNLPSDPADASVIAGLISGLDTKIDTIDNLLDTEIASIISAIAALGTPPTAAANAAAAAVLNLVDVEDSLPKYSMGAFAMAFLRFSRSGSTWASFKPSDGDALHTYTMTTADADLVTAVTP